MKHLNDNYYPVFNFKEISVRLCKDLCYFKYLRKKSPVTIVRGECSYLFLKNINGITTIKQIVNALSVKFKTEYSRLLKDYIETIEPLVKQKILYFSNIPVETKTTALNVLSKNLRNSLHIDLTELCNEKCIHCLADKDNKTLKENVVLQTLKEGAKAGLINLSLSGGEAMLHPSYWKIAKKAREYGYAITLFTNGLLINEENINKIVDICPETVRVSLYSLDEEIHDSITQIKGSLNKTLNAINLLKKYKVPIYINCPVMKQNFDNCNKVKDFADKNKFEVNLDPAIQPSRNARKSNNDLKLSPEEYKKVIEIMFPKGELGHNVEPNKNICSAGTGENYYINSKGDVSLCPGMNIFIGNINNTSFSKILQNDFLTEECKSLSIHTLKKCNKCLLRKACQRCHARAYRDTGDLRGCSPEDFLHASIYRQIMQERKVWNKILQEETVNDLQKTRSKSLC